MVPSGYPMLNFLVIGDKETVDGTSVAMIINICHEIVNKPHFDLFIIRMFHGCGCLGNWFQMYWKKQNE